MKNYGKRLIGWILTLTMLFSLVSGALAASVDDVAEIVVPVTDETEELSLTEITILPEEQTDVRAEILPTAPAEHVAIPAAEPEATAALLSLWPADEAFTPIGTAEELKKIGTDADYPLSGHYRLTADVTMDQMIEGTFSGVFDGNGYTISMDITVAAYSAGLFQELSGTVANLITDGAFTNNEAGGQTGAITGGLSGGTIQKCWNKAAVTRAGGWNTEGTAGIAGMLGNATIENCLNTGTVTITADSGRRGGIANANTGGFTLTNCCSTFCPADNGYYIIGGELQNYGEPTTKIITNCYYFGDVDRPGESHEWNSTVQGAAQKLSGSAITNPDSYVGWDFTNVWTMGANGPELVLPHLYLTAVTGGTADKRWASLGESVTVTADVPGGQKFVGWIGADGLTFTSGSASAATAAFTVSGNTALTAQCVPEDAHYHDGVVFTPWDSTTSLPATEGSYYLTADVAIGSTWNVPGTTNLCLNGHGVRMTGSGSVISVPNGATLNLYDCDTTTEHKFTEDENHLATVDDALTGDCRTFTGGYITGGKMTAKGTAGGGVNVGAGGTLNMYGGTVIGNSADKGGGVYTARGTKGTFNLYNGTIRNNNAIANNSSERNGGGVFVDGTFVMNGGMITENWCANAGGGILVQNSAVANFTMNGGTITRNYRRGLVSNITRDIPIGPDAVIENNDMADIWLLTTGKIKLTGARANTTPISILMSKIGVFTSSENTSYNDPSKFIASNADYRVVTDASSKQLKLETKPEAIVLDAEGKEIYCGNFADMISAEKWTDGTTLRLFKDVTTAGSIDFSGTKTLDLNGCGIRYGGSNRASVLISSSQNGNSAAANLTVIDSNPDTVHKITLSGYRGTAVEAVDSVGTTSVDESGNGVVYTQGGYLTGGTGTLLSGNIYIGGAIYLRGANKAVTLNGGNIVGNVCEFGGCLHCSHGTFTLNGGNILYNKGNGAAFNMDGNSKLYLYGGEVSCNSSGVRFATDSAAAIVLGSDTGSTAFSGNGEYGVWLSSGRILTIGGALTNTTPIGITLQGGAGVFTSGWSAKMGSADPASYFVSDNSAYSVFRDGDELAVGTPAPFEGAGTETAPYLIQTAADWNALASAINGGDRRYSGKAFKLTDDISVTTPIGNRPNTSSDSNDNPFIGTFDGGGHTLTVNIDDPVSAAPFGVAHNATIENLIITGSVHSDANHAAGVVAASKASSLTGASTLTIRNVTVRADVSCNSHVAGIVGHAHRAAITMENVVFEGSLDASSVQGGFIGWGGITGGTGFTASFKDCLFTGTYRSGAAFYPVAFASGQGSTTLVNDFYTTSLGSGGSPIAPSGAGQVKLVTARVEKDGTAGYYESFSDALNAWKNGGTLTLFKDVSYSDAIQIRPMYGYSAAEYTLDLNGKTLTAPGSIQVGHNNGNLKPGPKLMIRDSGSGGTINLASNILMVDYNGTVEFYGGTVTGGGGTWGGAVLAHAIGYINLYDGVTFTGNNGQYGGAIFVGSDSVMNMYGGTITGNTANKGGGVIVSDNNNAVFNLYGGEISGNRAPIGGGVCVDAGSFHYYGGTVQNNTSDGTAGCDLYFATGKVLTLHAAPEHTAPIGVTAQTTGVFTDGWKTYMGEADPSSCFASDNSAYVIHRSGDEATLAAPETTPNAVFTANGTDSGTLTGVAAGMQYSVDGGANWNAITDTTVSITGVTAENGVKLYAPGNGTTTLDSETQTINVTKAATPELSVTQPSSVGGAGSVSATAAHEYSADNGAGWTACTENQSLEAGYYLLRVKAAGTALASDAQSVTITTYLAGAGSVSYVVQGNTVQTELSVSGENTPAVQVANLDLEAQRIAKEANASVTLSMSVEPASAADSAVSALQQIALYRNTLETVNINVTKTVDGVTTALGETENVLEIVIPYSFTGRDCVTVYRCLNGNAAVLQESDTKAEDTFQLDRTNGQIRIYVNKSATYAIGFTQCYTVSGAVEYGADSGAVTLTLYDEQKTAVATCVSELTEGVRRYTFTHVLKGPYTLTATWEEDGKTYSLEKEIEVGTEN